jgi:RNA polymerase sigma-70 factor (ECF subfamily)
LVGQAVDGHSEAFVELYWRYAKRVFHYVVIRVESTSAAEDITQEVFFSAYRGLGKLSARAKFAPWLLRIAHNRVLNHRRARDIAPTLDLDLAGVVDGGPDEGIDRAERAYDAAAVVRALAAITALQQQVIALRFIAGLSVAETAEAMGRSISATKNLQHHGLTALRRRLDDPTDGGGA